MRWPVIAWWVCGLVGFVFWWMVFYYAPREQKMGDVQRIFYMHLPMAWTAMLAYALSGGFHLAALWKRNFRFLFHGWACVWVGVGMNALVLATGMAWARPIWGSWWPWEPRLTTTFLMWVMYAVYLVIFRVLLPENQIGALVIYNLLCMVNIPIVYIAPRLWRGLHPVVIERGEIRLDPAMWHTVLVGWFWAMLLALLIGRVVSQTGWNRFRFQRWLWQMGVSRHA